MKIRFLKTDPRAGMVADLDSSRCRQLVEQGAAEYVDGKPAPKAKPKPKGKKKAK